VVFLVLCLGNIGPEYADTRHNIGFMVADYLAAKFEAPRFEIGRHAFTTSFKHKGHTYALVKPTTYMNLSGKAAAHWLATLKITAENMIVVTDDLALPFGKLRLKGQGSAGGHNGLKDIQATLGTDVYARLRFGVDGFGASAPIEDLYKHFGLTADAITPQILDKLEGNTPR